ncbi:Origin recognition complex subunit 3 [Coemansia sp. RSA 485]|nr:Origin recognition complex subunit 3 [Coemansia sp. RSA 485]
MDVFDSMTESTFILKPSLHQQKQQIQRQKQGKSTLKQARADSKRTSAAAEDSSEHSDLTANDGYVPLFQGKEPIESMRLRQRLFDQMWTPLEQRLVDIERKVNNAGVSEVCRFVDSSYQRVESVEKGQLAAPFAETAAAVVFSGVNTGDHSNMFHSLQEQLAADGHYVALLESQYCSSLPTMLKCLLDQIYECISIDSSKSSNNKETAATAAALPASIGAKAIGYDMSLLRLWWSQISTRKQGSRIVVILQDFEGFAPMVVDDFIRIATNYCHEIPIVVVFGLATSYEIIHQSLTKASISMLNVERFNLQRSKQCIDAAIRSVFVDSASVLCFGAEAYKSLLDQFLLYNFSISGFVKKLKFAAMDFYYAQPLSVLSAMVGSSRDGCASASISDCPIRLSRDQTELIRMQRSVQRFLDSRMDGANDRKYAVQALVNDDFFQDTVIPDMLRQLVSYRHSYSLGIAMVLGIQDYLPQALQKPLRTLHYYGISQPFDACAHWKTLFAAVRRMKAPEMAQLVQKLEAVVSAAVNADLSFAESKGVDIRALVRKAAALIADPEAQPQDDDKDKDSGDDDNDNVQEEKVKTQSVLSSKRIRTRTDMENCPFLLFDKDSSDQMLRALDKCCGYIESVLRVCLSSYQTVPLHEIFYYRHSLLLDTTFSPQPRAAVQAALGKTQYYIDCDCCKSTFQNSDGLGGDEQDSGEHHRIMPSMNDTSIAYRLHQECGRMINLYDWFSAFSSVVEQEDSFAQEGTSQSEIQARFLRAVEEMRFLGFIKSTQRKTDHVVRLTWGM